jgi:hypothetical protein
MQRVNSTSRSRGVGRLPLWISAGAPLELADTTHIAPPLGEALARRKHRASHDGQTCFLCAAFIEARQ